MLETVTLRFVEEHPEDAARVLETVDAEALAGTVLALPRETAARVMRHLTPDALAGGLRALGESAAPIVEHLPIAVAAPALRGLPPVTRRALLDALPRTVSVPLGLALRYPTGTVGASLDPMAACAQQDMTLAETVRIARRAPELLRRYVYVLDDAQQLVGVLDVREFVLAPRNTRVDALMLRDPEFLRARAALVEAGQHPAWSRLDVLPVVDRQRTFVGVLRRRVLEAAIGRHARSYREDRDMGSAALDLAKLYWHASTAVFLGAREPRSGERER